MYIFVKNFTNQDQILYNRLIVTTTPEGFMKTQDFNKRVSIVVRDDLETWQILNTIGHISAYFGNCMGDNFGTDDNFTTRDQTEIPRNSQYPIIILKASKSELERFSKRIENENFEKMYFIKEMIETTDDTLIQKILSEKSQTDIEHLGIGVFGDNEELRKITRRFSLWK